MKYKTKCVSTTCNPDYPKVFTYILHSGVFGALQVLWPVSGQRVLLLGASGAFRQGCSPPLGGPPDHVPAGRTYSEPARSGAGLEGRLGGPGQRGRDGKAGLHAVAGRLSLVTESARAHSYIVSKQVQKTC